LFGSARLPQAEEKLRQAIVLAGARFNNLRKNAVCKLI